MTGLVQALTDNAGIITKQETRGTDEEPEEIGPEGSKPCSIQPRHGYTQYDVRCTLFTERERTPSKCKVRMEERKEAQSVKNVASKG